MIIPNYIFNTSTKQITFVEYNTIKLESIQIITNVTSNILIYDFGDNTLGGTVSGNVLTLTYNTSSMSNTDSLSIIYSDSSFNEPGNQQPEATFPSIPGQQPIGLAMPVALANEQFYDLFAPIVTAQVNLVNQLLAFQDCLQYRTVAIQFVTGSILTGSPVITFESNNTQDNSNGWTPINLLQANAGSITPVSTITLVTNTNYLFSGPINYRYFRARISTAGTTGVVTCSTIYRMAPYATQLAQSGQTVNVGAVVGNTTVTAGVNGLLAVGGNNAPSVAATGNPLPISGVDLTNLVRRITTDVLGNLVVVGPDPTKITNTTPLKVTNLADSTGPAEDELMYLILLELKLMNLYLKELPKVLDTPNGVFNEDIDTINYNSIDRTNNI
jgi:hypothetical protein